MGNFRIVWRWVLTAFFVVAGIGLLFLKMPLLDPWQDEFFQALNVRAFDSSPIAMLSFFIGHVWCEAFGDNIFNIRLLTCICLMISNALGVVYFYRKTHDGVVASFLFMTVCSLSTHCTLYHFGWDIGAYPFIMLTLLATLNYVERKTLWSIALVGMTSALMVLSRIPTLAALPLLLAIIIWRNMKSHRIADKNQTVRAIMLESMVGLAVFAMAVLAVLWLTVGIGRYVGSWNPENIVSGHLSLQPYIDGVIFLIPKMLKMWGVVLMLAFSGWLISRVRPSGFGIFLRCLIFAVAFLASAFLVKVINLPFHFGLSTGILWVVLFYIPVHNLVFANRIPGHAPFLWIVFGFAALACVGSDHFLERPLALPTIPVIASVLYHYRCGMLKWFFLLVLALSLKINLGSARILSQRNTYVSDIPRLANLHIGKKHYEMTDSMKRVVESAKLCGKSVGYLGLFKDYYYYLFEDSYTPLIQLYHYDENNPEHLDLAVRELKGKDMVIIHWASEWDSNSYELTSGELAKYGFEVRKSSKNYLLLEKKSSTR